MLHVSIDTCCLLNLLAGEGVLSDLTGRHSQATEFHIPQNVSAESIYLLQASEKEPAKLEKVAIDLSPYFSSGALRHCELEGVKEIELFVQFASSLDDGEAACLAIAKNRKWFLATDDRVAARLAASVGVQVMTTPMLIRRWSDKNGTPASLSLLIESIQRYARFCPHHTSLDYEWWMESWSKGRPA